MFTGIVEVTGTVVRARSVPSGRRLTIEAGRAAEDAALGASVAVNGVCLTVAVVSGPQLDFDVIAETLRRTNLGRLTAGDKVNLERSLRLDGRLDGHLVQGHVDGRGTVTRRQASPEEWMLWLRAEEQVRPYIVPKGSVALDGISLTVAVVEGDEFAVAAIPTTLERTTLGLRQPGDEVNIESDIIVRTIIHQLRQVTPAKGLTAGFLQEHGYL